MGKEEKNYTEKLALTIDNKHENSLSRQRRIDFLLLMLFFELKVDNPDFEY